MKFFAGKHHGESGYMDIAVGMIITVSLGTLVTFGFYHITNKSVLPSIQKAYSTEPAVSVNPAKFRQRTDPTPIIDIGEQGTGTDIKAFYFQNSNLRTEINTSDHSVTIYASSGTDVTHLVPSFALSDGASASVSEIAQVSGQSAQNFSSNLVYLITAESGRKTAWVVSVQRG